jgi:hypothetical protein
MNSATPSLRIATATLLIAVCVAFALYSREKAYASDETATAHGVTVEGYLRDAECPLRYKKSMKPEGSCAMDCIKKGAPIALITTKGDLFVLVDPTPEKDVRPLVMPHFGKYVSVTGDILERGGMRAITVKQIKEVPDNQ